jgi:hypothetical protein
MTFQLWEDQPPQPGWPVTESRCIAQRTGDQIKPEYHTMKIGDIRTLPGDDTMWIIRTN